jgi:hypothetical protein
LRQRGGGQIKHRRQQFLAIAVHAVQVARVDRTAHGQAQRFNTAIDGVRGDRIAEAVVAGGLQAASVHIDLPVSNGLSGAGRGPHAKRLDDHVSGLTVAVDGVVDDGQLHD